MVISKMVSFRGQLVMKQWRERSTRLNRIRPQLARITDLQQECGSGCFGRIRIRKRSYPYPAVLVGSGCFVRILVLWKDSKRMIWSDIYQHFENGRIGDFWSDQFFDLNGLFIKIQNTYFHGHKPLFLAGDFATYSKQGEVVFDPPPSKF